MDQSSLSQAIIDTTKYGYAEEYVVLDGKPFAFKNHNYLIDLYLDKHKYIVIEKSAQMGASIYAIVQSFYVCDKLGLNTIYFFPTDTDVTDFSKTRVAPILNDSPHLGEITSKNDSQGLRRVGQGWMYFRGMKSSIAMKCHDEQTEVLTRNGWKHFIDCTTDDVIATRSPSGVFMWQRAVKVWNYDYDGEMVQFKVSGLDALVTPNHRMLVHNSETNREHFELAAELKYGTQKRFIRSGAIWKGEVPDTFETSVIPRSVAVPYSGKVGCVSVPNGVILTRRNGQMLWSGNSIPADCLVFDELDEVSESSEALADQRLNHSMLKWRLKLSTPTFEGFGIDREFRKSDKRYWNLICKKCDTRNIMEFQFPDCVRQDSETEAYLICRKCKSVLDTQYGAWIPENPKATRIHGYHICGLYSAYLDLAEMMEEYNSGRRRDEFYRSKLGIPFTPADQRITREVVDRCIGDFENDIVEPHTFMGVDQKGNELHIVIRKQRKFQTKMDLLFVGKVRTFAQLDAYIRRYDVDNCVIDGTPNQHSAREFAARFPGRVYLCYYNENQKGDYNWNEPKVGSDIQEWSVSVNRTEALDAMYEEIMRREVQFPRNVSDEFKTQLCNLARINETDEDGTILRAVWKRLGEEHFAHANSYSLIAQSRYGTKATAITVRPKSAARVAYARQYESGSRY